MERAARQRRTARFESIEELDAFFTECARRETGNETDWETQKVAIAGSMPISHPSASKH